MNYNEDWREDRRRNEREDSNYNQQNESRSFNRRPSNQGQQNNDWNSNRNTMNRQDNDFEASRYDESNRRSGRHSNSENRWNSERNEQYHQERGNDRPGQYGNTIYGRESQEANDYSQGRRSNQYDDSRSRFDESRNDNSYRKSGPNYGYSENNERRRFSDFNDFNSYEQNGQSNHGSRSGQFEEENSRFGLNRSGNRDYSDGFGNTSTPSHRGKGPKNYKRDDSRIREDVNDALTDHHNVDASDIDVEVKDGNVILSGNVQNRSQKREVENAIDYISGIKNIENRIHVKSSSSPQSETKDWSTQINEGQKITDSQNTEGQNKYSSDTNGSKMKSAKTTA